MAEKQKRGAVFNHREITPGPHAINAISHPQTVKPVVRVVEEEPIIVIDTDAMSDEPTNPAVDSHYPINPAKPVGRNAVPAAFTVLVCKNCSKYPLDHFEVAMFPHMNEGWCSLKCWQACIQRKCCG